MCHYKYRDNKLTCSAIGDVRVVVITNFINATKSCVKTFLCRLGDGIVGDVVGGGERESWKGWWGSAPSVFLPATRPGNLTIYR